MSHLLLEETVRGGYGNASSHRAPSVVDTTAFTVHHNHQTLHYAQNLPIGAGMPTASTTSSREPTPRKEFVAPTPIASTTPVQTPSKMSRSPLPRSTPTAQHHQEATTTDNWTTLNKAVSLGIHSYQVRHLAIECVELKDSPWRWLLAVIPQLPRLEHLSLKDTAMTDARLSELAGLVCYTVSRGAPAPSAIRQADLFKETIASAITPSLTSLANLRSLNLADNYLTHKSALAIGKFCMWNIMNLQALDLSGNELGDHGAQVLAVYLSKMSPLRPSETPVTSRTRSSLSHNSALSSSRPRAEALKREAQQRSELETTLNNIIKMVRPDAVDAAVEGLMSLCPALRARAATAGALNQRTLHQSSIIPGGMHDRHHRFGLVSLDVSDNKLDARGVAEILAGASKSQIRLLVVSKNAGLPSQLYQQAISNTNLSMASGFASLQLSMHCRWRVLDLSSCGLGTSLDRPTVRKALLNILFTCQFLEVLDLSDNNGLGDVLARLLYDMGWEASEKGRSAPRSLASIQSLNISNTSLSDVGAATFMHALLDFEQPIDILSNLKSVDFGRNDATLSPDGFSNLITFFTEQESPVAVVPLYKMCISAAAVSFAEHNPPPSPPRAPSFRIEETPSPTRRDSRSPNHAPSATAAPTPYSVADISAVRRNDATNSSPMRLDIVEATEQEGSPLFASNYSQHRYEDSPTRLAVTRTQQRAGSPSLVIEAEASPPKSPGRSPQAVWRQPSRSPSHTQDAGTSPINVTGATGSWNRKVSPASSPVSSPTTGWNTTKGPSSSIIAAPESPKSNAPTPSSPGKIPSPLDATATAPAQPATIPSPVLSNAATPLKNYLSIVEEVAEPAHFPAEAPHEEQSAAVTPTEEQEEESGLKKKKKKVVKKIKRRGSTSQVPSEADHSRSSSPVPEASTPSSVAAHQEPEAIAPAPSIALSSQSPSQSTSEARLAIDDKAEPKVSSPSRHWADGIGLQIDPRDSLTAEAAKPVDLPAAASQPASKANSPKSSPRVSASKRMASESPKKIEDPKATPEEEVKYMPLFTPRKKDPTALAGKVKDFTLTYSHPPGHVVCQAWHSLHMHLHCEQLWLARAGPDADVVERESTIALLAKLLPVAAQQQPTVYGPLHAQGTSTATLKAFFRTAITERAMSLRRAMVADIAFMMQPAEDDKCVDKVSLDDTDEMMGMCTFTIKTNERRMQIAQRLQDKANAGHQEPTFATAVLEGPSAPGGHSNSYLTDEPTDPWKHLRHYMQHCIVSPSEEVGPDADPPPSLYSPPFTQDEVDWFGRLASSLHKAHSSNALQLSCASGCHLLHDHHGREDQLIAELPEDMVADSRQLRYKAATGDKEGSSSPSRKISKIESFGNISAVSDGETPKNESEVAALESNVADGGHVADAAVEGEGSHAGSPPQPDAVPSEPKVVSQPNSPRAPGWQAALGAGLSPVDLFSEQDASLGLDEAPITSNEEDHIPSIHASQSREGADMTEEAAPKGEAEAKTKPEKKRRSREKEKSSDKSPATPTTPAGAADGGVENSTSTPKRSSSAQRFIDEEEERAASVPSEQLVPIQQLIADRHKRQLSGGKAEFIQTPFAATPTRETEEERAAAYLTQQKDTRVQLLLALCYNSMNMERIELDEHARNKVSVCKGKLRGQDSVSVSVEWDQLLVIKRYRGFSEKQIIFIHPLVCSIKATQSDPKSKELLLTCEQPFGPSELGDKLKGDYKGTPDHKKKMVEPDTTPAHSRLASRSADSSRSVSPSQQQFANRRVVTMPIALKKSKDVKKAIEIINAQELVSHAHFEKMIQKRMDEFHKSEKEKEKAAEKEKLRKAAIASSARPPTPPPRG